MSASSAISDIPGVLGCVIGDSVGHVLEQSVQTIDGESIVAVTSVAGDALRQVGSLLGMGKVEIVTIKGDKTSRIISYREGSSLTVEVDPSKGVASIETKLQELNWLALVETPLDDEDIEYVPASISPTQTPITSTPRRLQLVTEDSVNANLPKRPTIPVGKEQQSEHSSIDQLCASLRRALIKGQLAQTDTLSHQIESIARQYQGTANPCEGGAIPQALIDGIANVLAGDVHGGLLSLKSVERSSGCSPSIRWVSLIWCARATSGSGNGFEVATAYAQTALSLAGHIDTEARAVSTYELAELAFHNSNYGRALELTRHARALYSNVGNSNDLADCWLLEARALAAIASNEESLQAAEHAQEQRPSWSAPATFIARRALIENNLKKAEAALKSLLKNTPIPSDIERTAQILEHVKNGSTSNQAAYDFLSLVDAPPTGQVIRQLEELSETYPKIAQFRDAFGWKLLRAGNYESAAVVFERLSNRGDLPDEVRASVLLGLGCLAAVETRHAKTGVKLQATVGAAPKHLRSHNPVTPSSGRMRAANPVEFRLSDAPPPPTTTEGSSSPDAEDKTHKLQERGITGGPVFSGSLQMFCIPDLLEFLRSGQRTGTLVCSSTAGIGAIHMRQGRVNGAAAPHSTGLIEHLIRQNVLSREQATQFMSKNKDDTTLVGMTLINQKLVTIPQLKTALNAQIREAIKELIPWGAGQFAFDPEELSEQQTSDIDVEIDPQELLLDLFRELDESNR